MIRNAWCVIRNIDWVFHLIDDASRLTFCSFEIMDLIVISIYGKFIGYFWLTNILEPKWFSFFLALTLTFSRVRGRSYSLSLRELIITHKFFLTLRNEVKEAKGGDDIVKAVETRYGRRIGRGDKAKRSASRSPTTTVARGGSWAWKSAVWR